MIPLPPAELTVVKADIADREGLCAQIETTLATVQIAATIISGSRVLIKPSALLLNRNHRNSHLQTLRALTEIIQARGGIVSIGDSPNAMLSSTRNYWRESGLADLAEQTDCKLFNFEASESSAVMVDSRAYYLPESLNDFDLIINAAALGIDHDNSPNGVIQNCLGFLPGRQLEAWDRSAVAVDLYAVVAPQLHLLHFDYQGQSLFIFGEDGVAVDTAVMSRLKGRRRPKCLGLAAEAGLGIGYTEMIVISGAKLPQSIDPELPELNNQPSKLPILERMNPINVFRTERVVAGDRCDGCAGCCDVCPTGSIRMSASKAPIWNMSLCIKCWRCREHCPSNAIAVAITRLAP